MEEDSEEEEERVGRDARRERARARGTSGQQPLHPGKGLTPMMNKKEAPEATMKPLKDRKPRTGTRGPNH